MTRLRSLGVRLLALLLAAAFAAAMFVALPGAWAEEENKTLHIGSKAELLRFSENCTLDSYSKGLSVYLDSNIELLSEAFDPIPIFFGRFDGQGHTISGLSINEKGSSMGLFRTVEYGASVRRLTVSGSISPSGSACSVGVICGINYGIIADCVVSGAVRGVENTGGIAGKNSENGIIGSCVNNATVTGGSDSGGISGLNEGLIDNCKNAGLINTTGEIIKTDYTASQITELTQSLSEGVIDAGKNDAEAEERDHTINAPRNTGGIAGKSSGIIRGCSNEGTVGYTHLGYNTGGIVGIQDGIVASSENRGSILGRKDVGGIVGQFEPDIAISYDSDKRDLEAEINKLSEILRTLANTVSSSSDSMLTDAGSINSAVDVIESSIKETSDAGTPQLQTALESVYRSLQDINGAADRINSSVIEYTAQLNAQSDIIITAMNRINSALDEMSVSQNINIISQQFEAINTALSNIASAVGDLESLVTTINGIIQDTALTPSQQRDQILEALRVFTEAMDKNSIKDNLNIIAASAEKINAQIKIINEKLATGTETILQQLRIISRAAEALTAYTNSFSSAVTSDLDIINRALDSLEDVLYNYGSSAIDRWDKTFDTVYGQLNIINGSLKNIISTGQELNASVNNLINSAIDQFQVVGQAVSSLLETPQYTAVDVSDTIDEVEKPGQISVCRNEGAINADVNVGGIVGIMAMEVGTDPETDFDMSKGLWTDTTALFRAIVMHGSNTGSVTSKNGNAGGIVGRCDIGALYLMYNIGDVSASAALCGGLAGSSGGSIINCYSMCALSGTDEVGGCAGSGHNISHCRTMVTISGEGEKQGAIAGSANGEILDNIFVLEELAGIDGISYDGKAHGLPYTDFIGLSGTPDFFRSLHIDFVDGGALVKRVSVEYGGDLPGGCAPALPSREDSYGVWESFTDKNVIRNQVVDSQYLPWEKTVALDGDLPSLLAEGEFSNEAVLESTDSALPDQAGFLESARLSMNYSLTDPKMPVQSSVKLHVQYLEGGDYVVYIQSGDASVFADAVRDGSYLVFSAPLSGRVTIFRSYRRIFILSAIGLLLLILVIVGVILLVRRRRCRKAAAASSTSRDSGETAVLEAAVPPDAAHSPENAPMEDKGGKAAKTQNGKDSKQRRKGAHQK